MKHWLARAKRAMEYAGQGALWLPGSTTWQHYMPMLCDARRAIREAQRRGWLSEDGGLSQLTSKGYREIN